MAEGIEGGDISPELSPEAREFASAFGYEASDCIAIATEAAALAGRAVETVTERSSSVRELKELVIDGVTYKGYVAFCDVCKKERTISAEDGKVYQRQTNEVLGDCVKSILSNEEVYLAIIPMHPENQT